MAPAQRPDNAVHGGPSPWLPQKGTVVSRQRQTHDVITLGLEVPGTFSYRPGQFNMLYVHGVGEVPISISGHRTAENGHTVVFHTIKVVGNVTQALARLKKGESLGIRGPYGSAWPIEAFAGNDLVLIAGGIGLAPIRPLFLHVLEHRETFGNVFLLYGARTPADIVFRRDLEQWRKRFDINIEVTVDHAWAGWYGNVGVVTKLVARAPFDPVHAVCYICGPEIMMWFTVQTLRERGVPDTNILLSMERNMKCAIGFCGHCQYGPEFICKDGPVFPLPKIWKYLRIREL